MADSFDELCASHANEFANDVNDEDMQAFLSQMERPIHQALRSGKILCPKDTCVERMGFFEENGIDHHFRVKHNGPFTKSDSDDSERISRSLYEKETNEYLQAIFRYRQQKVRLFLILILLFQPKSLSRKEIYKFIPYELI